MTSGSTGTLGTTPDEPLADLADITGPAPRGAAVTFRTGLLRTRVDRLGPRRYRWTREPGSLAPEPFQTSLSADGLHDVHPVLCPGELHGAARGYSTTGDATAATRLLRDGDVTSLAGVLTQVGQALRALHEVPVAVPGAARDATSTGAVPRALRRYDHWVAGRAGTPAATCALEVVERELGTHRWERLARWRADLAAEPPVLSHGAPGLGSVVLGADGRVDLLTGEDLCLAPQSFDTGWLLGELVELRLALGGDAGGWNDLTAALAAGSGGDLGPRWNLAAAFRVLLHLHDYTAYVAWDAALISHYARFVGFLLDVAADTTVR